MSRQALIIGGTGQIGIAIAERLLREDWQVTTLSRGEKPVPQHLQTLGVRSIVGDRGEASTALGDGVDVVVDTIAFDETHASELLALKGRVGFYVVVSSASVYADTEGRTLDESGQTGFPDFGGPITEGQHTVKPGPQTYSTRKIAMEQALIEHSDVPVTILRPCAIYGLYTSRPRELFFVKRALDGRKHVALALNGTSQFQTTSCASIAQVTSGAIKESYTGPINIGDIETPSVKEIGMLVGGWLNHEWEMVPFAGRDPSGIGNMPWGTEKPFTLDTSLATRLSGPMTRYEEAAHPYVLWLAQTMRATDWQPLFPSWAEDEKEMFDYPAEDAFIKNLR